MEHIKVVLNQKKAKYNSKNKTMTKSITGRLESCTIKKTGITNNKPWTIYQVTINGEQFSTFDAAYKDHIGQEGTWEYEEKPSPDGQYINRTLSRYPEIQTNAGADSSVAPDNIIRGLGILRGDIKKLKEGVEGSLEAINGLLQTINAKISPPGVAEETPVSPNKPPISIDDSDIPVIEDNVSEGN